MNDMLERLTDGFPMKLMGGILFLTLEKQLAMLLPFWYPDLPRLFHALDRDQSCASGILRQAADLSGGGLRHPGGAQAALDLQ